MHILVKYPILLKKSNMCMKIEKSYSFRYSSCSLIGANIQRLMVLWNFSREISFLLSSSAA